MEERHTELTRDFPAANNINFFRVPAFDFCRAFSFASETPFQDLRPGAKAPELANPLCQFVKLAYECCGKHLGHDQIRRYAKWALEDSPAARGMARR
tara:strand:- start:771 stop:1061 length:291 start_codon:yes stop_codon:yes gene_type:complete